MKNGGVSLIFGCLLIAGLLALTGCTTTETTLGGAAAGGTAGAIIGHQSGQTAKGALLGAGAGTLLGYIYGNEQDKKAATDRIQAAEARAAAAGVVQRRVEVRSEDGKSFRTVVFQQEPNGWVIVSPPTGEVFDNLPTQDELRVRGYGPGPVGVK
jgi:surface antigen